MSVNWIEVGRRVSVIRRERGLTQEALGRLYGLSTRGVSDLEHGRIRRPSGRVVIAAQMILGGAPLPEGETPSPAAGQRRAEVRQLQRLLPAMADMATPAMWAAIMQILPSL